MSRYTEVRQEDAVFLDALRRAATAAPGVVAAPNGRRVVVALHARPAGGRTVSVWLDTWTTGSDVSTRSQSNLKITLVL
jgi:hypothetical protein